jgi:hypothetical protein
VKRLLNEIRQTPTDCEYEHTSERVVLAFHTLAAMVVRHEMDAAFVMGFANDVARLLELRKDRP